MTRRLLLILIATVVGAASASAQPMPMYGNPYPPVCPAPYYGYSPYGQPVQYPTGYYPNGGYSGGSYSYPRGYYPPSNYGYNNGYGVNYYYMKNPLGTSATPAPYSATATQQALENAPGGWPTPAGGPGIYKPAPPCEPGCEPEGGFPGVDPPAASPLVFFRKPAEWGWVSADYLGLYARPMRLATPLVTTGSPTTLRPPGPGGLGDVSTTVIFGDRPIDFGLFSGLQLKAGLFLDCQNHLSLEMDGFWVAANRQTFIAAGDANGNPLIARPIFNVSSGTEGAFLTTAPATVGITPFTGSTTVLSQSDLGGLEFNFRYHAYLLEHLHADVLAGFRWARLAERLQIRDELRNAGTPNSLTFRGTNLADNESLADEDDFRASNDFFGPQFGGRLRYEDKWFDLETFAKLGLGVTRQQVDINGSTTLISPAGNQVANGGILALPSNSGTHTRSVFGILPELGIGVGLNVTKCIRLNLGYSFLMWNKVVRPGGELDRSVNPGQVPSAFTFGTINGPNAPAFRFNDELFWTHNFTMGVEVHF